MIRFIGLMSTGVLHCVAVCCSMHLLQCVAVCCSVLLFVAVCCQGESDHE